MAERTLGVRPDPWRPKLTLLCPIPRLGSLIVASMPGFSNLTERRPKALRSGLSSQFENSVEIGGHFHRQAISKSVIIVDVPIAIGRGEGRGNNNCTEPYKIGKPIQMHSEKLPS
jgi:hypothetical protein